MIVLLIQFLLFNFYTGYIWIRKGVQKSISDSWYIVDRSKKWMFMLVFCYGIGFLNLLHSHISSLFFFSGAFLIFTGTASDFKSWTITKYVHYIGAIGAITFASIGLFIVGIKWVIIYNVLVVILLYFVKNRLWWIEIACFYAILGGLLNYYLTN